MVDIDLAHAPDMERFGERGDPVTYILIKAVTGLVGTLDVA